MRAVNLGRWRPWEIKVLGPEVVGSNPTGPTNRDFSSLHGHVPSQSSSHKSSLHSVSSDKRQDLIVGDRKKPLVKK